MKFFLQYLFCFLSTLLIFSCRKDVAKINRGNYPDQIGKIIVNSCAVAGCHNAASSEAAASYNLDTWESMFLGANSGSPVIPYNSKFSSLCYFINTYPELGTQIKPTMPLNGTALSSAQVKLVKDWIDAGAPDINGKVMWANDPFRKKLYATNQGCDVVTVFDAETQLPIRFIQVGRKASANTPHQVRISPDGKYWYVLFVNDNVMQKFRCSDDSYVGDIPLTPFAAGISTDPQKDAFNWNTFVITKDSRLAYCVSWPDGKLAKVDLSQMKLLNFIGGLGSAHAVVLNNNENIVYVAAQTGNFITAIDTGFSSATDILLENANKNTSSSLDPHDMILSPDGNNLLITCQRSNEVRALNLANQTVRVIPTGTYPQEIIYSKNTNAYYVSCPEDTSSFAGAHGTVVKIEAVGYMTTKIRCGFQPHGIAVDETKKLLYVLSRNILSKGPAPHHTSECVGRNGFVNFVDLNTFTPMKKRYELSVDPYFIFARQ